MGLFFLLFFYLLAGDVTSPTYHSSSRHPLYQHRLFTKSRHTRMSAIATPLKDLLMPPPENNKNHEKALKQPDSTQQKLSNCRTLQNYRTQKQHKTTPISTEPPEKGT